MKRSRKQRRKKLFPGPLDPGYFERAARAANKGDTDSARLLLVSFRESMRHRRRFEPAVLRHLYRAFTAILDYERDANEALLLSKRRGRPVGAGSERHIELAIAVKVKLESNTALSLKEAFGEVENERTVSLATVERAWKKYHEDVQKLFPKEIGILRDSDD
jgi:hypothetical protein